MCVSAEGEGFGMVQDDTGKKSRGQRPSDYMGHVKDFEFSSKNIGTSH